MLPSVPRFPGFFPFIRAVQFAATEQYPQTEHDPPRQQDRPTEPRSPTKQEPPAEQDLRRRLRKNLFQCLIEAASPEIAQQRDLYPSLERSELEHYLHFALDAVRRDKDVLKAELQDLKHLAVREERQGPGLHVKWESTSVVDDGAARQAIARCGEVCRSLRSEYLAVWDMRHVIWELEGVEG